MCGRLGCTLCPDDIVKSCQYYNNVKKLEEPTWIDGFYDYKPMFNAPPTSTVAVLSHRTNFLEQNPIESEYCIIPMRWGMLPTYKTDKVGNFHTHNARVETLATSALYKPCISTGKRCAVLATGYYEWQTTKGENNKQPYFIHQEPYEDEDKNKNHLIKLAGLYNIIHSDDGVKHTCTILTKESDKSLSWMHHRMPIILNTDEDIDLWLNFNKFKADEALKLVDKTIDDKKFELKYYPVDKSVNNSSFNDKKCMERASAKRKSTNTLDNWLKKAKK